jgi:hypothetical protein
MGQADEERLLVAIKANRDILTSLLDRAKSHWGYEDAVYRFYHGSFKVYGIQQLTLEIVSALRALLPERELNKQFLEILSEGTGKVFTTAANADWNHLTRPLLEAFFHARYFLEMAVKYGQQLEEPTNVLPSGWAGLLYLYNLR